MAKKPEDYRITRGKALIAEKKRVAANPQKGIGLPSRKNVTNAVKQIGGAVLTIAGPGKVVKGVRAAYKIANARKVATAIGRARSNSAAASKMVAQKASLAKRQQLIAAQDKLSPNATVKIKSGGDIKSAASSKRNLRTYTPNPGRLPDLIKIDSAKGNSLKKTAYRPNRRTSN